ncbi:MAG: cobalamin-binding protein [Oscillochloridaceae bacterium]|nr:cobalamin-binding protein [Chloroflexaceae bacterium]MDW8390881.1 cobalamin-binding protein [Oscillochloridaceae bacterium]
MRIVSLLPSTTEIAFALGLGDQVVAVTHECDYPPEARQRPVITASALDHHHATSAEIDAAVRGQLRDGISIYTLDTAMLERLQPDLVLTQALCDVCAVSFGVVEQAVAQVSAAPRILSLEPTDLEGIFGSILAVGNATGRRAQAVELVAQLRARVERVRQRAARATYRPRVACLEWFDPPFGPGHWLPELVELAGGRAGLGAPGEPSRRVAWDEVVAFAPEVIVLAPCGFDLERARSEALATLPRRPGWDALPAVRAGRVFAVDANSYFSRPGPRVVDSLELLARLIHPDLFPGWGPPEGASRLEEAVA